MKVVTEFLRNLRIYRSTLDGEMNLRTNTKAHEHVAEKVHVLVVKAGVPYEIEQQVCADCRTVLDEKPVKRAAA